jgi:hypothetical protein
VIEAYCSTCAATRPFEQPPCLDDHGPDCDEWCCTACGEAVLIDPPHRRHHADRPALPARRAA